MSLSTPQTSVTDLDAVVEEWEKAQAVPQYPGMSPEELVAFRQSDEGKALVAWVKEKFQKSRQLRDKEEGQWNYNLAMYNGNQWVERYPTGHPFAGKLGERLSGQNRTRLTINRIKPICRTEMAKFMSQKPGASVVPATDEDEDILAAQAGEQAWYSTYERTGLATYIKDAVFWMVITGNGFVKITWDASKEDPTNPETVGDICYSSVSPYQMFIPDINEKDIQKQPFVIQAFAESTERLSIRYAEVLGGVELTSTCRESSLQEASFASPRGQRKQEGDEPMTSNTVIECWVKPGETKRLPQGGMVILIDDTLVEVHKEGIPYDHGQYPYAHLGHIETERFWRTSIIEDIAELQRDYNSSRSQIAESRKKMGKPQILAAKGSIVASRWTNEIGQVVEYKSGLPIPQPMPLQNIPQYILNEVEFILRDFEDISGQHEVSKGQTPPGVTAATAISYLQESDDSYLLPSFKNLENQGYGVIAKQTLQLFQQYWDVPRLIKIVGKDDAFSTMLLSQADIARASDIRIEPGSSLPQSKAARQAFIMDLMMNNFVPPNEGLDMLEIGGKQKLMDLLKNDIRQAQRENIKFKRLDPAAITEYNELVQAQQMAWGDQTDENGTPIPPPPAPLLIPVNDWDNHQVHIDEHDRFRRTQEFEILPAEIKTLMQEHVEQHKLAMSQQAVQQMLDTLTTDGSVPGVSGVTEGEASVDFSATGQEADPSPDAAPGTPQDAQLAPEGL